MSSHDVAHYLYVYRSSSASHLREIVELIPRLSYPERKKLMTILRSRCYPQKGTSLYNQVRSVTQTISQLYPQATEQLRSALQSPMLSGFLLSAVLSAPYTKQEVAKLKDTLMWKEVSVMESVPRAPAYNWFNLYDLYQPIHVDLKQAPSFHRILQRAIYRWQLRCSTTVLYPHSGTKGTSFNTRNNLEVYQGYLDSDVEVTTSTLEHYYARTGIEVGGDCEMRQRWYPTQASPRTYFAQGGDAYRSSKFLRDPFNWLCDSIRPTNRFDRVSISGLEVDEETEDVWIYDLTSFTSLFHEHWAFLHFLAVVSRDVQVTIFDSWEGPLLVSLGELVMRYANENVRQPCYSTKIPALSHLTLCHSVAGFLGVFGNIATCTFPHGIALSTVRDSEKESWCAGDDAGSKDTKEGEGRDVENVAVSLGSIAWEKTFIASQLGAVAMKRSVLIFNNVLYQRPNILWPIFSILNDQDPRFSPLDTDNGPGRVCNAVVSFLQSCVNCPMSPFDIEFAYTFFCWYYGQKNLPLSGWYPPLTGHYPWDHTVARISPEVFGKDPLNVLVDSFYGTQYVTQREEDLPWEGDGTLTLHNVFECNSSKHLSYLRNLGYLMSEPSQTVLMGEEGKSRAFVDVGREKSTKYYVYRFTVIETIPLDLMSFVLTHSVT